MVEQISNEGGLTAPDWLADLALSGTPTIAILLLFVVLIAAELLFISLTRYMDHLIAVIAAQKYQRDLGSTYQAVRSNQGQFRSLKRRLLRYVMLRLSGRSLLVFTVSLFAGAVAWAVASLINANTGGVIQTLAIVVGIVLILLVSWVVDEIVSAVLEEDVEYIFDYYGELTRD